MPQAQISWGRYQGQSQPSLSLSQPGAALPLLTLGACASGAPELEMPCKNQSWAGLAGADFWLLPQIVTVMQIMQINIGIELSELYSRTRKACDEPSSSPAPVCTMPRAHGSFRRLQWSPSTTLSRVHKKHKQEFKQTATLEISWFYWIGIIASLSFK